MTTPATFAADAAVLARPPRAREYLGMSVMTAHERAGELVRAAAGGGVWTFLPEHLETLRMVIRRGGGAA